MKVVLQSGFFLFSALFSLFFFTLNRAPLSHLGAFMSVFHEQTIETTIYIQLHQFLCGHELKECATVENPEAFFCDSLLYVT